VTIIGIAGGSAIRVLCEASPARLLVVGFVLRGFEREWTPLTLKLALGRARGFVFKATVLHLAKLDEKTSGNK
jgi:hypothetical protein